MGLAQVARDQRVVEMALQEQTLPLGGIAPRLRRHLHQPDRLGRRAVVLVEGALRAHDRIDDAAVERGADRAVARHADVGKGVVVERKPAGERGLADQQHRLRVVVLGAREWA